MKKKFCLLDEKEQQPHICRVVNAVTGLVIRCAKDDCPAWVELLE